MGILSKVGRIFFGLATAEMGVQTIYLRKSPYMMLPPHHYPPLVQAVAVYFLGILFVIAGVSIVCGKKGRPVSLMLGFVLLLIFCFYFIPNQFISGTYKDFVEWENAEKELALAGGAFVMASLYPEKTGSPLMVLLTKLIPLGTILFALPIICFGIYHFMGPQDVADYTPAWVPFKIFWAYFCGAALICSGIAIIFKIKPGLIATLLGIMILSWFIILHVPRVVASSSIYLGSEITSAVIALAYSGIAFVIAGKSKIR